MIISVSRKIAQYIYNKNDEKKTSIEVYRYGVEVLLSILLNTVLILSLGWILNIFIEIAIFMLAFGLLRVLAGGYHAKTHLSCFLIYISTAVPTILLIRYFQMPLFQQLLFIELLSLVSLFLVYKFAPVDSKNRPMSHKEIFVYRTRSRGFITFFSISLVFACLFFPSIIYYVTISAGAVFIESITLLPKFNKKEDVKNEKTKSIIEH
ncbi:MAG: accessory gene regulator ArgB-like protein [Eubacteriaceae bacterium]